MPWNKRIYDTYNFILANVNADAIHKASNLVLKILNKVFVFIMPSTMGIPRLIMCYIQNQLLHLNFMKWPQMLVLYYTIPCYFSVCL